MKTASHLTGIAESAWAVYEPAVDALIRARLPFALTGGQALACYTGRERASKDLDIVVLPGDRDRAIEIVQSCGFEDYYSRRAYDRHWIFRLCREETIFDVIWAMPNRRAWVDAAWIRRGPVVSFHGKRMRVVAPEELLWAKLYILQRDRCDWPDIMNLLYVRGPALDWRYVLDRLGPDSALLSSVMVSYCWLRPNEARKLPAWIWSALHLPRPGVWEVPEVNREALLDTRDWFPPAVEPLKEAV